MRNHIMFSINIYDIIYNYINMRNEGKFETESKNPVLLFSLCFRIVAQRMRLQKYNQCASKFCARSNGINITCINLAM